MPSMSLRRRISLAFALLICCALLALATSLLMSTEEREEELIDEIVNTTLSQIEARWPIAGQLLLPKNLYFYHAPLGQHPAGLATEIQQFGLGNSEYFAQGREFHVGVREYQGSRLYVLYDTSDHEERLKAIYLGVSVAVLLLSGLALTAGYFFAGSILRQLSALTAAVEQDWPIELRDVRDREVAILARAIGESREQKAVLLQRERDFTAHVGHELRTPLTRIRTSAELLRELGDLGSAELARVAQIEAAADEMQERLSALLFLARDLRAISLVLVNLRQAVDESLLHFATQKNEIARLNELDPELWIAADRHLLKMLLDNLLGNALRYTQSGQIAIRWQNGVFCLSDTGEGIANADLSRVLAPFERASNLPDGFGLGLALVQRICEAMGWQCQIQSQLGQGTQILIHVERAKIELGGEG